MFLAPFPSGLSVDTTQSSNGKVMIGMYDRNMAGFFWVLEFVVRTGNGYQLPSFPF
jgi:hypothetical protein